MPVSTSCDHDRLFLISAQCDDDEIELQLEMRDRGKCIGCHPEYRDEYLRTLIARRDQPPAAA